VGGLRYSPLFRLMNQRMNTKPTIYDVASHAKVSMKTVSRVINQEANVSEHTRKRVNDAIAALGWQPNLSARALAGGRSYLIGMIYDNPSASYISELQRGALQVCSGHGRHLLVFQIDSRAPDAAMRVDEAVRSSRLDGVILSPPVCDRAASALCAYRPGRAAGALGQRAYR